MKNRNTIINKLFAAILLTGTLIGTISAQKTAVEKTETNILQIGKSLQQNIVGDQTFAKINNSKLINVSEVNRENFNLGSKFVIALINAEYLERDQNTAKTTIVDLVYLIDALENQLESAALQKKIESCR